MALELPDDAREAIAGWRDQALSAHDELRLVPAEYLHVTLVFLGWQYERDVDRIASLAFGPLAGFAPATLAARGLMPVPKRGPRLFALDLDDDGGAAAVQEAAAGALGAARLYEPEKRPFWPHVTLARLKRGRRAPRVEAESPPTAEPFQAAVVTLYRSVLQPQGARYESLHRHTLG